MNKNHLVTAGAAVLVSFSMVATAYQAGDWIIRGGATTVDPNESSSSINVQGLGGGVADTGLGVTTDTQFGLTVTHMFSDHVGVELLASTPFEHDITVQGGGLSSVVPTGTTIATVKHLPPTLSAQYFFMDSASAIQPYAGVGINYWLVVDKKLSSTAKSALGAHNLKVDNSTGLAFQLGVDYNVNRNWLVNAAVWNIGIKTSASFDSSLGKVKANVNVDPWVYMVSVGYAF